MKVASLAGNSQWLDGGAMFGHVPRALWKNWIPSDDKNRIHLACRSLYIESDQGQKILFDVGIGDFFEPKLKERYGVVEKGHLLLKNLEDLGTSHEEIDIIILSHLHFDHAGGLLPAYGEGEEILFPKAKIWLSKQHWERAQHFHIREKNSFIPGLTEKLAKSGRLELIDLDKPQEHPDIDVKIVIHASYGHTVGLMLAEFRLEKGPLLCCCDLVPGEAWLHLPVTMGYDRFPEHLVDEKQRLLEDIYRREGYLFFTHDPKVDFVKLEKRADGRFEGRPCNL